MVTGEVEADATKSSDKNSVRFSPELVDEKIRASLEPLHAQAPALTEMMDRLIQSNSARVTTTSTRETRWQYESLNSEAPVSSWIPTAAPLTSRRVVSRFFLGGGGGLKTLYIKIGYRESSRTESRQGSQILAENSRVT